VRPVYLSRSYASLRSSSTTNFAMPQLWTKYEEHTFSHAGPAMWNALLEDMRAISDSVVFRKRRKTHFLWPPYVADVDIIFLPSFFFSPPNLSRHRLDVYGTSTHDVASVQILTACLKYAAYGSLEMQDPKNRQKCAIWAPSHNFVGRYLRHLYRCHKDSNPK